MITRSRGSFDASLVCTTLIKKKHRELAWGALTVVDVASVAWPFCCRNGNISLSNKKYVSCVREKYVCCYVHVYDDHV